MASLHALWDCGRAEKSCRAQVAITGSTKGLGLALAEGFLELGDDVVGQRSARVRASSSTFRPRSQQFPQIAPQVAVINTVSSMHLVSPGR